jgi:hypothetical protein
MLMMQRQRHCEVTQMAAHAISVSTERGEVQHELEPDISVLWTRYI